MISIEHLENLGEALRELRWEARMKQVEVCRATGLTAPQVSRYENGRETPTVESLVKYLVAVGADFADLQRVLAGEEAVETSSRRQVGGDGAAAGEGATAPPPVANGRLLVLEREGMERLEHRMRSLEEWMLKMKKAGE